MLKSFVGVASASGLEALYPENDEVIRFLIRRAYRSIESRSICFWVVMDDSVAHAIELMQDQGQRREALLSVCCLSNDLGQILPPHPAEPVFSTR